MWIADRWNKHKRSLLAGAIVALVFFPSRSTSSAFFPSLPPPPSDEELRMLDELTQWVGGGHGSDEGFRLFDGEDTWASIQRRRDSFEVFRRFGSEEEKRLLLSGRPYGGLILDTARELRLDALLLEAVVGTESGFDPGVVSPKGALGLMQLMPDTAVLYGVSDPLDPHLNLRAGASYLKSLLDRFDGDLGLALAAYNAGPGNVERFGGVPPFAETTRYVDRVLARYVQNHRSLWQRWQSGGVVALR